MNDESLPNTAAGRRVSALSASHKEIVKQASVRWPNMSPSMQTDSSRGEGVELADGETGRAVESMSRHCIDLPGARCYTLRNSSKLRVSAVSSDLSDIRRQEF